MDCGEEWEIRLVEKTQIDPNPDLNNKGRCAFDLNIPLNVVSRKLLNFRTAS
jgi:hypothetical protein